MLVINYYYYFLFNQVGDVRVQFSYAGLSGKPGAGLGDPLTVKLIFYLKLTFLNPLTPGTAQNGQSYYFTLSNARLFYSV